MSGLLETWLHIASVSMICKCLCYRRCDYIDCKCLCCRGRGCNVTSVRDSENVVVTASSVCAAVDVDAITASVCAVGEVVAAVYKCLSSKRGPLTGEERKDRRILNVKN